jgi:methyltransferase (TIGR00027 family)
MSSDTPAGRPVSRTALNAAAARAAHLVVDAEPYVHVDPLAAPLLGDRAEELIAYHRLHGDHPVLSGARAQVLCRSRYAEARADGAGQYVVLAAGLDSYAYRSPGGARVFEVDRAQTQAWKRAQLSAAGIAVPSSVAYVAADLGRDPWVERLVAAGFDPRRPAVIGWLGCTVYLTLEAIRATLSAVAGLAPGTEILFDYLLPRDLQDDLGRIQSDAVAPSAAEWGEPWLSHLAPEEVARLVTGCGLALVADLDQRGMTGPGIWDRSDALRPAVLQRLAHARVP